MTAEMAAHSRHDGEAADSLLTILSLNCNTREFTRKFTQRRETFLFFAIFFPAFSFPSWSCRGIQTQSKGPSEPCKSPYKCAKLPASGLNPPIIKIKIGSRGASPFIIGRRALFPAGAVGASRPSLRVPLSPVSRHTNAPNSQLVGSIHP